MHTKPNCNVKKGFEVVADFVDDIARREEVDGLEVERALVVILAVSKMHREDGQRTVRCLH